MGFAKSAEQVASLLKSKLTLDDIITDIQNNTEIELHQHAQVPGKRPVPSGGRSPFMFIGQNPSFYGTKDGRFEEGQELKFFEDKKLGKWIDKICENLGVRRQDVYVTNAIKYPTENNDEPFFKDGKSHIKHFFYKELYVIKPEIIFVMGKWTQKLFEKMFHIEITENKLQKITIPIEIAGKQIDYETWIYPIYHPAYVERSNDFNLYLKQLDPIRDQVNQIKIDWKYIHLHVHNSLSMKDGIGTPETRVQWAVENGKQSVSTTNHGNICDWLNIYNRSKSAGLKPILGMEFYFNRNGAELQEALGDDTPEHVATRKELKKYNAHFTGLAKNIAGYHNIIKLHNDAWINRFYRSPIVSAGMLEQHHEGIIALSGCMGGEQNKIINRKTYLQSDKRAKDIQGLIENKLKSMRSLMRSKDDTKFAEDDNFDSSDMQYFYNHQEEKLNETEYKKMAEETILRSDKEQIASADIRAREIVDWWHNLFGEDYYIELMLLDFEDQRIINHELIKIAKEKNIPVVITNDAHYIAQADAEVQALQMLNDQDKTFEDLKNDTTGKIWTIRTKELYFKTVDELKQAWDQWHKSDVFTEEVFWEGINNAIKVADKVENYTIDKSSKLPKLYDDPAKVIAKKISDGLKYRKLDKKQEYLDRAKFEFTVIIKKGYTDYFLILEDIIRHTKEKFGRFSVGAGRGSAAGSLVNYLLEITDVDPLKHDLMFERFLDVNRYDPADVDSDFEPRIRDYVVDYITERFGSDHVAPVGTFGITRTKVAIQDVARVFGIAPQETFALTKNELADADDDSSLEELEVNIPALKAYLDKWEKEGYNLRYFINGIRNSHRQVSQHAAGVLVSSDKLIDSVPLIRARKRIVTGWQEGSDYHELSDLGYQKFDILGLNNLQVVNDAHKLIKERRGIDVDWDSIDLDEEFVYKNVVQGQDHYGCFQFESPLGRRLMKDIMPDNFEELSAVSSLLRPGPLKMGMDKEFADRKHDRKIEGRDYEIPACIRDILGPTYGVIVYQEQFMKIANKIGGLNMSETNAFRKALVKYSKSSENEAKRYAQIQSYHDRFIETASKSENLGDKLKAEELWSLIASFSQYGFNKSHSISYTYTSFREYWLKAHYDPEFNIALLNNTSKGKEARGESVISQYITEVMKKGYKVLPAGINVSRIEFSLLSDTEIVWGLGWVKNLSDDTIHKIIEEREKNGKYTSIANLFERVGKTSLNKRAIDALVWSGALDEFTPHHATEERFDLHKEIYETIRKEKKYKFINPSAKKIIEFEIEYNNISLTEMGFFVTLRKELESATGSQANHLYEVDSEGEYFVVGKVDKVENKKTKTKKDYKRISLRDETKVLRNVYLWPWKLRKWEDIKVGIIIAGKIEHDGKFINLTGFQRADKEEIY